MKRVVLVAPEFPPSNTAGAHRPRLFAKHLSSFGWKPTVITVRPDRIEGPLDRTLEELLPVDLRIIRTGALPLWPVRLVGDLGLRSLFNHAWVLARLCQKQEANAVVLFGPPWFTFLLGPFAQGIFKVPYIVDYIDPWISDWTAGKRFPQKAWLYHHAAMALEPVVLRSAAHVTAVSGGILTDLQRRYPWLERGKLSAMPYGAEPEDLDAPGRLGISPADFSPGNGNLNICFTGAIQPRSGEMLQSFFQAVQTIRAEQPTIGKRIRLHFYGTSNLTWGHGRYSVLPVAQKMGLSEVVSEIPERIPYLQAMAVLRACDVILVMGSWEHFYHASKLYPAILSKKPILGICHKDSSIAQVITETGTGKCVTFQEPEELKNKVSGIASALDTLLEHGSGDISGTEAALDRFSARNSSRVLAKALDRALGIQ